MGYVLNHKAGPTRYAQVSYMNSCSLSPKSWKYPVQVASMDDYVTSWRGPIEKIKIGSKERRIFHSFDIKKYRGPERSFDLWCSGDGTLWGGYDAFFYQLVTAIDAFHGVNPYLPYYRTSQVPMYREGDYSPYTSYQREKVEYRLYEKLKSPRWDGAVFFAELTETLVSIKDLFMNAIKAYTKAGKLLNKQLRRNKALSIVPKTRYGLQSIATHILLNPEELWLWYRYFLLPAMLDAEGLIAAIKPQATIDRVKAGMSKKTTTKQGKIVSYAVGGLAKEPLELPWTQKLTFRAGGAIDLKKRLDPSEWGTSATDCLRAAWEIIPFSFVFDWFVNFGQFLTTLREVEIDYVQSYATYVVESVITLNPGENCSSTEKIEVQQLLINRCIDLEPPTHPMVTDRWSTFIHNLDYLALLVGITKGILSRGKSRR